MVRRALWGAATSLGLFHVWIFGRQLWNGELSDVTVLGRWLLAAGLVWALIALRRQGASLFRGRQAVAIWVLAALLHGPAVLQSGSSPDAPGVPEIVVTLVEVMVDGAALFALALLLVLTTARPRPRPVPRTCSGHAWIASLISTTSLDFAPRPPQIA